MYHFGFPSRLVAIHFPSAGYAVLEVSAQLGSVNDPAFVNSFGFGLSSNYPLIKGNMLSGAGPTFDDPLAPHTALPWWHKTLKKAVLDTTSTGTSTVIDRGVYDVMTDVGEITLWIDNVNNANHQRIPYTVDFTGNSAPGPTPDLLDGRDTLDLGAGPNSASQVDAFLIEVFQRGVLPGASTFTSHLVSIISSHNEAGGTLTDYNRKYAALYIFDLSKIKAAVGGLWTLNFDVPGQDDTGFARQTAVWSATLSTWKTQKVFPQNNDGSLALNYAKATDVNGLAGPAPAETVIKSKHNAFKVDLTTLRIISAKQTDN